MIVLVACLFALIQTGPPAQPVAPPAWEAAPPGLAAQATGKPGYGLIIHTEGGRFLLTNLGWKAGKQQLRTYRILGPAGLGPYRYGFEFRYHPKRTPEKREHPDCEYADFFFPISPKAHGMFGLEPGSPAEEAGLSRRLYILDVDGKTFDWNPRAADFYLSTHASVAIHTTKCPLFFGTGSPQTFRLEGRRVPPPVDPGEGTLQPDAPPEVRKAVENQALWAALEAAKQATPEGTPLSLTLGEGQAILVTRNPWFVDQEELAEPLFEFWESSPTHRTFVAALPAPLEGRFLKFYDRWYRLLGVQLGAASTRPEAIRLEVWAPNIPALLAGLCPTQTQAARTPALDREAVEGLANDALLEWKLRSLPEALHGPSRGSVEDLVLRLEKGLLTLDLESKGIRNRLDAQTRAETERKAQAELAAKSGKPLPAAPATATESERLADLLDQRKAILMAILGSAKQALANLRR
jgi:hypothetical protein